MSAIASVVVGLGACAGFGGQTPPPADERSAAKTPTPEHGCDRPVDDRVAIPPESGTIVTGGFANLLAAGEGYVWVPITTPDQPAAGGRRSEERGRERVVLLRIEPTSGRLARYRHVGSGEVRIRTGAGAVWLADPQTATLTRLDVATGRRIVSRPFGPRHTPRELAVGADGVWLVPDVGGSLAVADLRTGRIRRRVDTGLAEIADVTVADGTVWVSAPEPGRVIALDERTGRAFGSPRRVGGTALDIEGTREHAWVDLGAADALARIERGRGAVTVRAPNGGDVFAIALGYGSVWATNYVGGTVTRLDDDSGALIGAPLRTGAQPKGVAVGEGAVWVANAGDCTISRIAP